MTIDKVKSTFQATELIQESNKPKSSKKLDEDDGLFEDRASDSDFDPENAKPVVAGQ